MHPWDHKEEPHLFPSVLIISTCSIAAHPEGSIAGLHFMITVDPPYGQNVSTSVWEQLASYHDNN